ncbi:unnamed protein product [Acanthosepion pharaonis]|uniref:Uncharacterized protein n=1 Tax=Acanthosepion pharaonis TaxID=158019 RepID=A0A812EAA8_ACAPH|nr:unnamed protein product [Sepia pharaonis]
MEVEDMPTPRTSSLKRSREEEEEGETQIPKHSVSALLRLTTPKVRFLSVPADTKQNMGTPKARMGRKNPIMADNKNENITPPCTGLTHMPLKAEYGSLATVNECGTCNNLCFLRTFRSGAQVFSSLQKPPTSSFLAEDVVAALLKYDTPSLKSSGLRAIPRLTLHGGFEIRRRRQNPACRGCQIGWPVRRRRHVQGDNSRSSGRARRRRAPPTPAMAVSSGTKRDAFQAFSRYRAEAAWHRRSFERAREPLLRSRGSSRTGRDSCGHGRRNTCRSEEPTSKDQKATSLRTLGRHKPVIPVVTFLTPLGGTELRSMGHAFAVPRLGTPALPFDRRIAPVKLPTRHGPRLKVERGPQSALARGPPSDPSPFSPGERGNDGSGGISRSTTPNDAGHGEGRKTGTNESPAHRGGGGPVRRRRKRKREAKSERRRREANPPPPAANPSPHDRIRYRQTKPTSTATDVRRPAPIDALPTPTKACLPPMLHLPYLLTESD